MCNVTIYMPCFNYGKYIEKAIESVINQTLSDWELLIINDGSTDNTSIILERFKKHKKIRIIDQENKGLTVTNNIALRLSNGKYIMRLDPDDYLDENALIVMTSTLDTKQDIGLVYPDYYHVNENGDIIELVRREKIEEEVQILDLPAHGACTMFRKEVLLQIGGYSEEFSCQDGYELWLRFIQKYSPYNVNIPLFYYRKHNESLTNNTENILKTRRKIKRQFVKNKLNGKIPKVLGIIPAVGNSIYYQGDPFLKLAGNPLIWYTLKEAQKSKLLDRIILSSESDAVLEYGSKFQDIEVVKRNENLAKPNIKMQDLILNLLYLLEKEENYVPDAVCTLYITTPLRKHYHVDKAIDTMAIFDVDSVISVQEELAHCYYHGKNGLNAIASSRRSVRVERESIYKENSAIFLSKVDVIKQGRLIGDRVGHIIMQTEESVKVNNSFSHWLAEKIIEDR